MLDRPGREKRWTGLISVVFITGVAALAACGGQSAAVLGTPESSAKAFAEEITVGISMYLLVDDLENPDTTLSSHRSEEELAVILAGMNEIWGQAGIHLELANLETIVVDADVLAQVAKGDIRAFFDRLGGTIPFNVTGPESSLISGFYTRRIGGSNGITPLGTGWYMVMDEPSVFDRRVSSHEVGHILGLRHVFEDPGRLLYPGTNGMSLTPGEITLTRYVAMELMKAKR